MSLNKLSYDKCSYDQVLGESLGPGFYQLTTPPNSCKPCHSTDPRIAQAAISSGATVVEKHISLF